MNDLRDQGDDIARGIVTECVMCDAIAVRHGVCGECGVDENAGYNPFDITDEPFNPYYDLEGGQL